MANSERAFSVFLLFIILTSMVACSSTDADREKLYSAIDMRDKGIYSVAFSGFDKLANAGDARAQYNIGLMYLNGLGVSDNLKLADKWFVQAHDGLVELANVGDAYAQFALADMYEYGFGVNGDIEIAGGWYKKAFDSFNILANNGEAFSQFMLGVLHRNGKGAVEDDSIAVKWFEMAANQGYANAQYNMGFMYREGQGIEIEKQSILNEKTMKWYRQAAEQGHQDAQFYLALMYSTGEAGVQNDIYAYMWYDILAKINVTAQRNRNIIATRLSETQIKQAKQLSMACIENDFKNCMK